MAKSNPTLELAIKKTGDLVNKASAETIARMFIRGVKMSIDVCTDEKARAGLCKQVEELDILYSIEGGADEIKKMYINLLKMAVQRCDDRGIAELMSSTCRGIIEIEKQG